eukprot:scaffold659_cov192-Ochromonas_danica.AAC.34
MLARETHESPKIGGATSTMTDQLQHKDKPRKNSTEYLRESPLFRVCEKALFLLRNPWNMRG